MGPKNRADADKEGGRPVTAKEVVRIFVDEEVSQIRRDRGGYQASDMKGKFERLRDRLKEFEMDDAAIAQHIEDAARYLVFFLSDSGRHSQGMKIAVLQNDFRAQCDKESGRRRRALFRQVEGLITGYGFRPLRVLRFGVVVWLFFALSFWVTSCLAPESAIIIASGTSGAGGGGHEQVRWFHYPYFSGVTLTTLGYGDIRPNIECWWGFVPAGLAVTEAVAGYCILSLFLAVLVNRLGILSYARLSQWVREYEHEVLGQGDPPPTGLRLYQW